MFLSRSINIVGRRTDLHCRVPVRGPGCSQQFCAARSHPLSACSTRDEKLTNATRRIQNENYCVFDMRKMHVFLNSETLAVEHVARYTVEHWN